MKVDNISRENGTYYTTLFNPFQYEVFCNWIKKHQLAEELVLEPFAGCNSLIGMLQDVGLARKYRSFDINPQSKDVTQQDTLKNYPKGFNICITNPPWLYKSRARRLGLKFPNTDYDDLYKHSLDLMLENCNYVGALLPASFLQSGLFQDKLEALIFINRQLFRDTESPVCLALFSKDANHDIYIYEDRRYIGKYSAMKELLPKKNSIPLSFNDPRGELGFVAIDDTTKPSIRFCKGGELSKYTINHSSRSISRISGLKVVNSKMIKKLNDYLSNFRFKTSDIFLTTFKGLRADGKYRRRMEYRLARDIIGACL